MRTLDYLTLSNFRSWSELSCSFDKTANLFYGENGSGKTNLLEAIYFCSHLKSFRISTANSLVHKSASFFHIGAEISDNTGSDEISIHIPLKENSATKRSIYLNGKTAKPLSSLKTNFPVLYLANDDILIAGASPSYRRNWFDQILSGMGSKYKTTLAKYKIVIENKNRALKNGQSGAEWNEQLAQYSALLTDARVTFLLAHQKPFNEIFNQFFPKNTLRPSIKIEDRGCTLRTATKQTIDELRKDYLQQLDEKKGAEQKAGVTLVGAHKESFQFYLGVSPLSTFGSQGQTRLFVYSLKLAVLDMLYKKSESHPALLVDDVFADLDEKRTGLLFEMLLGRGQIFLASANIPVIRPHVSNFRKFKIELGKLTET